MDRFIEISDSESSGDIQYEDTEEDPNLPSRDECEARCQKFAEVTGTDVALAMFYLQNRDWILEHALNSYYADMPESDTSGPPASASARSVTPPATLREAAERQLHTTPPKTPRPPCLTTAPPLLQIKREKAIRVLSWNIDGLDPDNLQSRTEGACSVLLQEDPEVIFLQEVVDRSLAIIQARCSAYQVFPGMEEQNRVVGAYFTVMLLRKDCVSVDSVKIADFPTSLMNRNLMEVQCKVKNVPLILLTSHLESTKEHSEERQKQLKTAFASMNSAPTDHTIIFGGDLNLRDKEVSGIAAKPLGIYDVWECTGKRPEAKFTWDLLRNDNKQMGGKFQPRCRFDRLYVRHSKPAAVKPVYFELVGIQRLSACRRFPSDHWGILAHFDVLHT